MLYVFLHFLIRKLNDKYFQLHVSGVVFLVLLLPAVAETVVVMISETA